MVNRLGFGGSVTVDGGPGSGPQHTAAVAATNKAARASREAKLASAAAHNKAGHINAAKMHGAASAAHNLAAIKHQAVGNTAQARFHDKKDANHMERSKFHEMTARMM